MKELIDEAAAFIVDNPERAELIYYFLTKMDDEQKAAFVLAYRILKEE